MEAGPRYTCAKVPSCKPLSAAMKKTFPERAKACLFNRRGGKEMKRDPPTGVKYLPWERFGSDSAMTYLTTGEQVAIMLQKGAWWGRIWEPCLLPLAIQSLQPLRSEFTCKTPLRAVFRFTQSHNASLFEIEVWNRFSAHSQCVWAFFFPSLFVL